MSFTQVEDIEFQSHVPKGELHYPISEIYNGIRSSQNGLPNMMGTWLAPTATALFQVRQNLLGSRICPLGLEHPQWSPFGILIDLSAKDNVMEVGFSSPNPSCLYMEYGSRFTLAPKYSSAFSTQVPPILTEIVGHPGSVYFTGVLHS